MAGGGVFQVKRHCQSKKHSSRAKELNHHVKIDSLVSHQAQDQVTHGELYFARVYQVSAASVIRLLKQFNNNSIYDVDAILMKFCEYKSLPDSQLPIIASKNALEGFWSAMGELSLLAGEGGKQSSHLAGFCKNLLILPHSTANPKCLFSIVGKVDTSETFILKLFVTS